MRVLFDNGTPRGVAAAEAAGFEVLDTADRSIRYQQNLRDREVAIVMLGKARWKRIRSRLREIAKAVADAVQGTIVEVEIPNE